MELSVSAFSCTILPNCVAFLITSFHDLTLIALMDLQSLLEPTQSRLLSSPVESQPTKLSCTQQSVSK
jgi:hypothetical protein